MAERQYTDRGFRIYDEFVDTYGKEIAVIKSSLATEDRVWIQSEVDIIDGTPIASSHLNVIQALRVITALTEFVKEAAQ